MNSLTIIDLTTYKLIATGVELLITPSVTGHSYSALGTVDGKPIEFNEYGFSDLEDLLISLRKRELAFFYGVDIPEVMERNELEAFVDLPETNETL